MRRRLIPMLLLSWLALSGCAPNSLTLMTFNIRYANPGDGVNVWTARRGLVAEVIEDVDPDVLGVQEALHEQLLFLEDRLTGYDWVGVGRDDGANAGEFAAIFYKTDVLTLLDSGTFWFSDTPGAPGSTSYGNSITRICTWARLRTVRGGRTLLVANVHLDHRSAESRLASMRQLRQWIADRSHGEPVFVLGDFNCPPESAPMRVLLDDGWLTATPDGAAQSTYHAFTGEADGRRIDMILAPIGVSVIDGAVVTRGGDGGVWPSDHFPVWARVSIESLRP